MVNISFGMSDLFCYNSCQFIEENWTRIGEYRRGKKNTAAHLFDLHVGKKVMEGTRIRTRNLCHSQFRESSQL